MRRILAISVLLSALIIPSVVFGACGDRPLCDECLSQETCEAKLLCEWDGVGEECLNTPVIEILPAGISVLLGNVKALFTDAMLWVMLVIGVPLGFVIIQRVIALMPKK